MRETLSQQKRETAMTAKKSAKSTGWTDEKRAAHAAKMREVLGRPEEKAKISERVKAYYAEHDHPLKGKTMSDTAKANIRAGVQRYYDNLKANQVKES